VKEDIDSTQRSEDINKLALRALNTGEDNLWDHEHPNIEPIWLGVSSPYERGVGAKHGVQSPISNL
jgi:hypothetical protein